jgi:hypothetical protein
MAAPRRPRKAVCGLALAVAVALAGLAPTAPSRAATTEYVVIDRNTGLAIGGFDPMAYFTDGAALSGRGEYEYRYAGAVWRFRTQGNRAAFVADPDVYMPRFGGYDPVGIARGAAVPGDPRLWLIVGDRLYLFYTEENRAAFANDSETVASAADRQWAAVQLTLSP